jgi:hypothetical protein
MRLSAPVVLSVLLISSICMYGIPGLPVQLKKLVEEKPAPELLIIVNPQWESQGPVVPGLGVSDFGGCWSQTLYVFRLTQQMSLLTACC